MIKIIKKILAYLIMECKNKVRKKKKYILVNTHLKLGILLPLIRLH